jgi:alkylation response protein AidB-like acyl-CoA dehydrogenase
VQDRIFADPSERVSGILSPSAVLNRTDGGYVVNGRWTFNTGAQQAAWDMNAAVVAEADGSFTPVMVAVPIADLAIVDDWHTSGLRGTGSVTTLADGVFVPADQVLPMMPILNGAPHASRANADSPVFNAPFMPTAVTVAGSPAIGLAKAARDAFFERLPGRKITYTAYEDQSQAPITHLRVAEAETLIFEAETHAARMAAMLDGQAGQAWTLDDRARVRLHLGAVCRRSKEAVDLLANVSGGSSTYTGVPIQRIQRDIQLVNLHAILHPDTNLELYGRVMCGLEPNTFYV